MGGWVYILKCSDGSFYTGSTKYLELRIKQHQAGIGGVYTSKRLPVELVYASQCQTILSAFMKERQIKGWSRRKKIALINGDFESLVRFSKPTTSLASVAELVEATEVSKHE